MKSSKFVTLMKMIGKGAWTVLSLILAALAAMFLILMPLGFLQWAMEQHWAWGFPLVAFLSFGIYISVLEFRRGRLKTWQGIQAIAGVLLLTILVFAFLSFVLNRFGAAHYQGFTKQSANETSSITFNFVNYYLWQLFELIPGLKINEAFGWNSPLTKSGFVAGFLLIGFRVVIVFVLLQTFREWWGKRGAQLTLENKELVQRWFEEVWNKGRAEAIDEMFAADGIAHGLSGDAKNPLKGPANFKPFHDVFRGAFPDLEVTVEDVIAEGDKVAARCSVRGKHSGAHLGVAATHTPVDFDGIAIVRIKDGKIVEAWNNFDFLKMNQQIGVK